MQKNQKLQDSSSAALVILISSTRPPEKTAAAITLARHFADNGKYRLLNLKSEGRELLNLGWFASFLKRLQKTRFSSWVDDFWYVFNLLLPLHLLLPPPDNPRGKCVVFTVACGHGWITAKKYASKYNLPLVVRFDDWWPDTVRLHSPFKASYSRNYRRLAEVADLRLCISQGMLEELGCDRESVVILPIPESGRPIQSPLPKHTPFRVCYLGNLYDYGPMLALLAEEAKNAADLRLEFRGNEPNWPNALKERMMANGQLHGYLEGEEFQQWYESFDCYLVAMFFEVKQRRRVKTCFATKLLDYASMGRPIVVWAPEESAVITWARKSSAAVCVTTSDPAAVITALRDLRIDDQKRLELGRRARAAYESDFDPTLLQQTFDKAIAAVVC
jgi:glycosyltransferase involved in cell wall biosynthesis